MVDNLTPQVQVLLSLSVTTPIVPRCRNCARLVPSHQVFQVQMLLFPSGAHHYRPPPPSAGSVLDWCPLTKCSRCRCCFPRVVPTTIVPLVPDCARLAPCHQVFQVKLLLSTTGAHHSRSPVHGLCYTGALSSSVPGAIAAFPECCPPQWHPLCRNCARMMSSHQVFQVQLLLSLSGANHNHPLVPELC
jgi:hypothetical protein